MMPKTPLSSQDRDEARDSPFDIACDRGRQGEGTSALDTRYERFGAGLRALYECVDLVGQCVSTFRRKRLRDQFRDIGRPSAGNRRLCA